MATNQQSNITVTVHKHYLVVDIDSEAMHSTNNCVVTQPITSEQPAVQNHALLSCAIQLLITVKNYNGVKITYNNLSSTHACMHAHTGTWPEGEPSSAAQICSHYFDMIWSPRS